MVEWEKKTNKQKWGSHSIVIGSENDTLPKTSNKSILYVHTTLLSNLNVRGNRAETDEASAL